MSASLLRTYWAMVKADCELAGEPIKPTDTVLSFSGSGASCHLTADDMDKAMLEYDRIAELERQNTGLLELIRKAAQLGDRATDWNLYEVEINGEMVDTYELTKEFYAALQAGEESKECGS